MLTEWYAAQTPLPAIVGQFTEEEGEHAGRPALAKAAALCKAQRATLVIVSTQAIGSGAPFEPRIVSVPVKILPQPNRPTLPVIPVPANSSAEVSLYLGAVHSGRTPVYLCNPKTVPLLNVTVTAGGFSTDIPYDQRCEPCAVTIKAFAGVAPGTAQLIEARDVMTEGESMDQRRVRFNEGGAIREGGTFLYKAFRPKFVALTFVDAPARPTYHVGERVFFWTGRGSHGYATIRELRGDLILLDPEPEATKGSDYRDFGTDTAHTYWLPRDRGVSINQINTPPEIWYSNY